MTGPGSVPRPIAVAGARPERHIYLILPSAGETSPAARRFAGQLLRSHPAAAARHLEAGAALPSDRQMDSIRDRRGAGGIGGNAGAVVRAKGRGTNPPAPQRPKRKRSPPR